MPIKINPLEVEIHVRHDEDLDIYARWRSRQIGHVSCLIDGPRLNLCDIVVFDKVAVPYPFAHTLLLTLGFSPRTVNARHLGIGNRLMDRLIKEARGLGIFEIWGSVTEGGVNASPFLLDWYRRFGFEVEPADKECIDVAKWKISMKLPETEISKRLSG